MFPRAPLFTPLAVSLLLISVPADATTLYTWHNADGSITFTDDPKNAPPDAQVRVWADIAFTPPTPEPEPTPTEVAAVPT